MVGLWSQSTRVKLHEADGVCWWVQHEVGVRNLEILNASTDARGRKLEVVKVHCPLPLFRTYKEAEGVHVSCPLFAFKEVLLCFLMASLWPWEPLWMS